MVEGKELHQVAHTHLQTKLFADLTGFFVRDAADFCQPLRLPLHNQQGLVPKFVHNPGSHPGADALDDPAGQIGNNLGGGLGHQPFQKFRFKLAAIATVGSPFSCDHQPLAGGGQRNGAHHGDGLPILQAQPQHRIAIVVILKHNGTDRAL